jgi:hypothetical protein
MSEKYFENAFYIGIISNGKPRKLTDKQFKKITDLFLPYQEETILKVVEKIHKFP